jgi:hypothetical protein
MKTRYGALLLVLSVLTGLAQADIYVDDDGPGDPLPFDRQISDPLEDGSAAHPFDSVQEAIDAAKDGDTIIVAPGHYLSPDPWVYDEISFKGKTIRLVSSAPTDFSVARETVLCGVVIFQGSEGPTCLLQGFKIQNYTCGGILGNGTQATVATCIISGNGPCGATVVKDVRGEVGNCLIVDNATFHGCAVEPVVSGCTFIANCTIANNISGVGFITSPATSMYNCIIHGNKGPQIVLPSGALPRTAPWHVEYCLIQDWTDSVETNNWAVMNFDGDPCFVQPGYWEGGVLIEGDYHLKSEGYRWSETEIHGSHWYFDLSTSCAIDAGGPTFGLWYEPERVPEDPESRWGINHAIDCGAYGGSTQASLAPNRGRPLGVGGVDLRDYLPFDKGNSWSTTKDGQTFRTLAVTSRTQINGCDVSILRDTAPQWVRIISCVYIDYMFYTIQNAVSLNWLPDTSRMQAKYPQILTVGSTIQAPDDPFAETAPPGRPAIVMRGTLAEVLAGTKFDPNQFAFATDRWGDVIAIREKTADGAPGEPMALFARGHGPMLLGGLPVTKAQIGNGTFTVGHPSPSTGGSGKRR